MREMGDRTVVRMIESDQETKYIYTGEELLQMENTEIPCLIEPILPSIGIGVIGGSSDTGKSSFLRQLATSICTGQDNFLDFKLNTLHNKVIYVSTEDDANAVSIALKKQNIEGLSPEAYRGLRFCFDNGDDTVKTLSKMINEEPVDCIIADAYSDLFDESNMNSTAESRSFLHKFHVLAVTHKCSVIFLHHISKAKETSSPSKNNLIGSQALEAKARVVFELRRDINEPNNRHLCIVKGNYLSEEFKNKSYVLEFNNMSFSATGQRVDYNQLSNPNQSGSMKDEAIKMAVSLKAGDLSNNRIAEEITAWGYSTKGTTVRDWVKKYSAGG